MSYRTVDDEPCDGNGRIFEEPPEVQVPPIIDKLAAAERERAEMLDLNAAQMVRITDLERVAEMARYEIPDEGFAIAHGLCGIWSALSALLPAQAPAHISNPPVVVRKAEDPTQFYFVPPDTYYQEEFAAPRVTPTDASLSLAMEHAAPVVERTQMIDSVIRRRP